MFKNLLVILVLFFPLAGFSQTEPSKTVKKNSRPAVESTKEKVPPQTDSEDEQNSVRVPTKKNERPGDNSVKEIKDSDAENSGQDPGTNSRPASKNAQNQPVYFYEFSQPEFTVSRILIEHDETGKGKISFLKKGFDELITDPIRLSPTAMEKVKETWAALNFLDSTEDYQYEKDYTHLGNMTFTMKKDGRERTAKFNWTTQPDAKALAQEYRKIANQFIWIFDIGVARQNQPLETPRVMSTLDTLVRRDEISDGVQMIPFLNELTNDERIPLIARNHAARIVKEIEKAEKKRQEKSEKGQK